MSDVRFRSRSGRHLLTLSSSQFDPQQIFRSFGLDMILRGVKAKAANDFPRGQIGRPHLSIQLETVGSRDRWKSKGVEISEQPFLRYNFASFNSI